MRGAHDAPKIPMSKRAKTAWGSAVVTAVAGIYSLIAGPPIPGSLLPGHRSPEPHTTGSIPKVSASPPQSIELPPKRSVFVKTSPSGSAPPLRVAPSPAAKPRTTPSSKPPPVSTPSRPRPVQTIISTVTSSVKRSAVVAFLHAQIGKPYFYGGVGPLSYDCSGLVQAAFQVVGIHLPRTSEDQATAGVPVSLRDLLPGDILFWGSPATHSAVYVGNGMFIGAENPQLGVALEPLSWDPPAYARRVI